MSKMISHLSQDPKFSASTHLLWNEQLQSHKCVFIYAHGSVLIPVLHHCLVTPAHNQFGILLGSKLVGCSLPFLFINCLSSHEDTLGSFLVFQNKVFGAEPLYVHYKQKLHPFKILKKSSCELILKYQTIAVSGDNIILSHGACYLKVQLKEKYYLYRVIFFLQLAYVLSPAQVLETHTEVRGVFTHWSLIWWISSVRQTLDSILLVTCSLHIVNASRVTRGIL